MNRWIEAIWYRSPPAPALLRPLAAVYGLVSSRLAARRRSRATKLPVPLVIVGNIAVGGTGKTPACLWLIEELRGIGHRPGVLSRGYRGRGPFPLEVDRHSAVGACGDEPLLIALRACVPLVVAPDRVAAGRLLLARHPEVTVLICDDGLQHYRLARDVEVCVIDGARGFGNGALLPAGPLREPPSRADAVDLVLVNGGDAQAFGPRAARFDLVLGDAVALQGGGTQALAAFTAGRVHAVAGIGNPARFFAALRAQGLHIIEHAFPDHHDYVPGDFGTFAGECVLMTEKDAVKCRAFAGAAWWSVPVELSPSADARSRLRALLGGLPCSV